jgi:hypothetical protein
MIGACSRLSIEDLEAIIFPREEGRLESSRKHSAVEHRYPITSSIDPNQVEADAREAVS